VLQLQVVSTHQRPNQLVREFISTKFRIRMCCLSPRVTVAPNDGLSECVRSCYIYNGFRELLASRPMLDAESRGWKLHLSSNDWRTHWWAEKHIPHDQLKSCTVRQTLDVHRVHFIDLGVAIKPRRYRVRDWIKAKRLQQEAGSAWLLSQWDATFAFARTFPEDCSCDPHLIE